MTPLVDPHDDGENKNSDQDSDNNGKQGRRLKIKDSKFKMTKTIFNL